MINEPYYVILAAGKGSRLGNDAPKCLTMLSSGETILARQVRLIREASPNSEIVMVVGYRHQEIQDALQEVRNVRFVNNMDYGSTNTSKSLLAAFLSFNEPVTTVWLNGDVVFSEGLLPRLLHEAESSTIVVNQVERIGDEEIKYTLKNDAIEQLSKTVPVKEAAGEAVGINIVEAGDVMFFVQALTVVENDDYFEKAVEISADHNTVTWFPFILEDHDAEAMEIDFKEDLDVANDYLNGNISLI